MFLVHILVLGALGLSASAVPKEGRISNGIPGAVPHQARVFIGGDPSNGFGGTLISDDWVITVASRTHLVNTGDLSVFVGESILSEESPTRHTSLVTKKVEHPLFVSVLPTAHDLALLQLASPALQSSAVKPAILPTWADVYNDFVGHESTISGWGLNVDGGEVQNRLLHGYVIVIDNFECQTYFQNHVTISETHICAKGESTTCPGDEGGPLVEDLGAGTFKLIGVSSFHSYFGCVADTTAGFSRVSRYLDWISETASIIIKD